jgi:hypothetical protein
MRQDINFKIDRNVPVPPRNARADAIKWTASRMSRGDSVGGIPLVVAYRFRYQLAKRGLKTIFRTEANKKTVRVWATA